VAGLWEEVVLIRIDEHTRPLTSERCNGGNAARALTVTALLLSFAVLPASGASLAGLPSTHVALQNAVLSDSIAIPGASPAMVTNPTTVFTIPQVPKPGYLAPVTNPIFNSPLVRIAADAGASTSPVTGTWGHDTRHGYSKQQAWNSDNTLLAIENRDGGSPVYLLLDGTTYAPKKALCSSLWDYRWNPSPAYPNMMINMNGAGTELSWYDVNNCSRIRSWTLPMTVNYGIGAGEGNPSNDGRFIALGNSATHQMVVVDMDPQPPYAPYPNKRIGPVYSFPPCSLVAGSPTTDCDFDNLTVSASGNYVAVNYCCSSGHLDEQDAQRIYEVDPVTLALKPHNMATGSRRCNGKGPNGWIMPLSHADVAIDPADGTDVIVGMSHCSSDGTIGYPYKVRLADGAATALTSQVNEAQVFHVSCRNLDRPGWAYISFWKEPGKRFSDEIVAVKLDGSLAAERICHIHSAATGCYRCEAHPCPSRDGTRVIFASTWSQDCGTGCGSASDIKDYVVSNGVATDTIPPAQIRDLDTVR
jgi:hypothetical protein